MLPEDKVLRAKGKMEGKREEGQSGEGKGKGDEGQSRRVEMKGDERAMN